MIIIQKFKQFTNSSDFYIILKIAQDDLKLNPIKYLDSLNQNLKKCIYDESILILYENNIPIGFYIVNIINRVPKFSFAYIKPEKRGKGYSYELIKTAFRTFGKKDYDKFITFIHKNNLPSLNNLYKILKDEQYIYEKEEITDQNGLKFYKFTIQGFK